jgi:hypothetical protein
MARGDNAVGRPRVWVPGTLYISDEREIRSGREVGYNGWGKPFAYSPCGHFGSIADWRHRAWMVERSALTAAMVQEHALLLPERLLDGERQPHARRWLAEQPLLCVSGAKKERLVDAGLRVFTVEHGVESESFFRVEAAGGKRASWMLSGRLEELWPPEARERGRDAHGLPASETPAVRGLVDRMLRWLSRGVLSEPAVVNALAARMLIEPGYGYHGDTDGQAASIEQVERELRALDALFGQIYQRAAGQRDDAQAIVDALGSAEDRAAEIAVPVYGSARRERLTELAIPLPSGVNDRAPRWHRGDAPQPELVLPSESRWIVDRVDGWSPQLSADLESKLEAEARRGAARLPGWVALALVGILLLIVAVALTRLR